MPYDISNFPLHPDDKILAKCNISSLDMWMAFFERIGDHATHLAALITDVVKGTDICHVPPDQLEREVLN